VNLVVADEDHEHGATARIGKDPVRPRVSSHVELGGAERALPPVACDLSETELL
jgi:hypothetical protein